VARPTSGRDMKYFAAFFALIAALGTVVYLPQSRAPWTGILTCWALALGLWGRLPRSPSLGSVPVTARLE
jgi:hypothetical protein